MSDPVRIVELEPSPAAVVRRPVTAGEIGDAISSALDTASAAFQAAGLSPGGPPFVRYLEWSDDGGVIEAGYPLRRDGPVGLELVELPGGRAAVHVHHGHYDGLAEAWGLFSRWIDVHAVSRGEPWEVYHTDPNETPADDWRTDLVWPID